MARSALRYRTLYQSAFSILIIAALVIQFGYGALVADGFTFKYIALFFSYFTILSNILIAFVLSFEAYAGMRGKKLSPAFEWVRSFAVFCIITTGVIYSFFLHGPGAVNQMANALPWTNQVFHHVMPAVMVADWLLFPPRRRVRWVSIIYWITLMVIYAGAVEVLGHFSHEYPYFFLDPADLHGYKGVLRACIAFIPFLAVFGAAVVLLNKLSLFLKRKKRS
jgi:hypothetical protein